jgi:hypothetical protein
MKDAAKSGNTGLVEKIKDQIAELITTIVELSVQKFQAVIDEVNKAFDFKLSINDVLGRLASLGVNLGQARSGAFNTAQLGRTDYGGVNSALQQRGGLLGQQRAAMLSLFNVARATGNMKVMEDLTKQILGLDVAIVENTKAIQDNTDAAFNYALQQATTASDFFIGINDAALAINNSLGTMSGVPNNAAQGTLLEQKDAMLKERAATEKNFLSYLLNTVVPGIVSGSTLQGLAGNDIAPFLADVAKRAFATGKFDDTQMESIRNLINAILKDEQATVDNTTAIKGLNGAVTQSFSSAGWRMVREAMFTGSGGLLPQYKIPAMATGGRITADGMAYLHSGEKITPAGVDRTPVREGDTNLYLTNPTEVLDPGWVGSVLAFRRSIDRAT